MDIVSCSNSEDCKECSDCNTVENGAFCDNGVCKCIFTVLYPSHDENNLDYINAKPEQIQSEEAFDSKIVTNKLENPETALQELANPQPKKDCDLMEFLETICSSDEDCKQCSNTPNGFCNDWYHNEWKCEFKTWHSFPFERELEMNKNDALDLPSFNLSVDTEWSFVKIGMVFRLYEGTKNF